MYTIEIIQIDKIFTLKSSVGQPVDLMGLDGIKKNPIFLKPVFG